MKNIRTIITAIFALCIFDAVNAQMRYADMKIEFVTPKPNSIIQSPQVIQFSFQILNQGPDTIYTTDSLFYMPGHYFGGGGIERRIAFAKILAPGDSIEISDTISVNSNRDKYPFNLALLPYPYAYGLDFGHGKLQNEFWEDRGDNAPSVNLNLKGNSLGVVNLAKTYQCIDIYPNPCEQNLVFIKNSLNTRYRLEILDVAGKSQKFEWIEPNIQDGSQGVSLINNSKGLYFFYFTTEDKVMVQKVIYE